MFKQGAYTYTSNDLELWFKVSGKGPICICPTPGWGVSADFYFHTLNNLEDVLTIVYLDTRGTGRSQKPPTANDYTYKQYASDLDNLRKLLNQEKILVLGHSQAGAHAMQYALYYPQYCAGLILLDTLPALDEHLNEDTQKNIMARQHEPWFEEAYAAYISEAHPQNDKEFTHFLFDILPFYFVDQDIIKQYQEAFQATTFSLDAMIGQETVQLELNLLPDLHKISVPTLLVVGSDDFICPPLQSERIHLRIPNSKLIIIQNAGHFPWLEQKESFFSRTRAGLQALNLIPENT